MRPELAERIEALRAGVLNVLHMRPVRSLFGMTLGVGIVDIRIVGLLLFVALLKARHAWIPPQRTALAGRRGQSYYVPDHCWVALSFQKVREFRVGLVVFNSATVRVSKFGYITLQYSLVIQKS